MAFLHSRRGIRWDDSGLGVPKHRNMVHESEVNSRIILPCNFELRILWVFFQWNHWNKGNNPWKAQSPESAHLKYGWLLLGSLFSSHNYHNYQKERVHTRSPAPVLRPAAKCSKKTQKSMVHESCTGKEPVEKSNMCLLSSIYTMGPFARTSWPFYQSFIMHCVQGSRVKLRIIRIHAVQPQLAPTKITTYASKQSPDKKL